MEAPANNPFQTPEADLASAPDATQPLYSLGAVGWATFFGTPLAGAYVLAHNLRQYGLHKELQRTWWLAIGIFVVVTALGFLLPDNVSGTAFTVVQVIAMYQYAKSLLGARLQQHAAGQGRLYSNWRAVGIGLLFILAILVVAVPLIMVFDLA